MLTWHYFATIKDKNYDAMHVIYEKCISDYVQPYGSRADCAFVKTA